jgi:urease accessory protein
MGLDGASMAPVIDPQRLLHLWLSPSFPVGAFAYSQGLEQAVDRGLVRARADLQDWMSILIRQGPLKNDLIVLAEAHRCASRENWPGVVAVNDLACALAPSAERSLETTQQGGSFLLAIAAAWTTPVLEHATTHLDGAVAYPVAVGLAAAAHAIPLPSVLDAYAFAWATTVTSAAIRLSVIGQTDAQLIVAALAGDLSRQASTGAQSCLDDLGSAAFSADLCSLEHETQYSRLFRS